MESVGGDDDLFVVIVGDEDESSSNAPDTDTSMQVSTINQVVLQDASKVEVGNIIETAEKYGQTINIEIVKQEPDEENGEIQDENLYSEYEKLEPEEEEQIKFEHDKDDEEYIVPEIIEFSEEECLEAQSEIPKKIGRTTRESQRFKMRGPEEQQSFVKELCEQFPELKDDSELLVETLGRIMLNIKRPEPPQDYFIMNNDMFECVQCEALTETIPAASRHWQEKHGPRYLICFACGVDFRSTTNLYKHEKRCSAPDAVWVLRARGLTLGPKGRSRPFLTDVSIRIRDKKSQEKKKFPCSQCAAVFLSKQSLQSHELKHLGARPYRCSQCPAAYTSACGLSRHRAKHSGVLYVCDHCKRPFRSKAALVVHFDTHKPLRKFGCSECGRRFAQKMALQLHVAREHRRLPPPCACPVCPKRYPRMSILKTHMLKEHGLNLITRKMFYKSLPMLSHTQLEKAKVILKSELQDNITEPVTQTKQTLNKDSIENNTQQNLSEELINLLYKIKKGVVDSDDAKYIVIQNGEAICVDGNNIELHSNKEIEEIEQELEMQLEEEDDKEAIRRQILLEGGGQVLCELSGLVVQSDK